MRAGGALLSRATMATASSWFFGSVYQRIARTTSSRKSTSAARFFWMKPVRAVHIVSCVMPNASFCVNKVFAIARRSRIERERRHGADQVGFLLGQHRAHGGEGRLDDGVVLVGFQAVLAQHRAHGDVDGAAHGVGGEHLALEVGDGFDRAVLEHHEFVGAVARHAVLDFVADHAQIVHVRVLDGERRTRKMPAARCRARRRRAP